MKELKNILVSYSGGVDSAVLAAIAHNALGENSMAVTADSETISRSELESAKKTASEIGMRFTTVKFSELDDPNFAKNPKNRCYFCKKMRIQALRRIAEENGIKHIADGTTASDLSQHRPGIKAVSEEGVLIPFVEFGITKTDIRAMARHLGLSVSEKPPMACLSSRFPYGEHITKEDLVMIERAEDYLSGLGCIQRRVRKHGNIARIEVDDAQLQLVLVHKKEIAEHFRSLGFSYITLDIEGFRSGSLDEV
ncbi:MAG: ATP-dependent sacrificial sulfur transferase LarE [Methanosarcinales archaeon]|nr:ATP-dependent sacrificial sulfur transferase LarE [Methanosarcinales archaeon]